LVDKWAIELLGEPLRSTAEESVRHRLARAEKGVGQPSAVAE
jgi:hypothetical protein